jgi:hypothetical protein
MYCVHENKSSKAISGLHEGLSEYHKKKANKEYSHETP